MILLDQPDTQYHLDPAIGSTDAKLALDSMQTLRDELDGLRQRKDSRAFQFGRCGHARFTNRALYDSMVHTGPLNPKTGKPYGPDTNAFAEWAAENPGKVVLGQREIADLDMMDKRMPAEVRGILSDPVGIAESSYYVTLAGVAVKCRPDWISGGTLWDIKTIGNMADAEKHIGKFRYWFSAAWYRMIVKAEAGVLLPFRFIFTEKNPPYRWRIVDMDADWIGWADATVDRVLGDIAHAQGSGDWSDKGELHMMVSRPAWESDDDEPEDGE